MSAATPIVLALLLAVQGCQPQALDKALASMDEPEVEVHPSQTRTLQRRIPRVPLPPAAALESAYHRQMDWRTQPRLDFAALVQGSGSAVRTGSVVPFLRSEISAEEAAKLEGGNERLVIKAMAPAKIKSLEWREDGEAAKLLDLGPSGVETAVANSFLGPGDKGKLTVVLSLLKTTAEGSVIRTSEDRNERPRFTLRELGKKGRKFSLKLQGELRKSDRPLMLQASTSFGHRLLITGIRPLKDGVVFEMDEADYYQTLVLSIPEESKVTLNLPVRAVRPEKKAAEQARLSGFPLVRMIYEDPNEMKGQTDPPA